LNYRETYFTICAWDASPATSNSGSRPGVGVFRHWRAAVRRAGERNEEEFMATQSGGIQPLYGVIIRDKCKTADLSMLQAYRTVANDLLKDASGPAADELKASVGELDKAIAAKEPK
jgi:hypothetical protein